MSRRPKVPALPGGDAFLTTEEAARALKVSTETLLTLDVPWISIGTGKKKRRRVYLASGLVEWGKRRQAAS